jgi:hypothetical protein
MLHRILNRQDPLMDLIKDDPVRPAIPQDLRLHEHADIFVLIRDSQPAAVTCVAYLDQVPRTERELGAHGNQVAAFYTIWSYQSGAGRELIQQAQTWIRQNRTSIDRFVTLSPKTEMARRFHHNNGAITLSDNDDTINYEYPAGR